MQIREILAQPFHPLFNISYQEGNYLTTNQKSFYRKNLSPEKLTFDVSNQKAVGNLSADGTLKQLSFYQDNFLTEEKPGVWVNKQFSQSDHIAISITVADQLRKLNELDHEIHTDLIYDSLPRIVHRYDDYTLYMVPFCPIVGGKRYSMLIYNLYLLNQSDKELKVELPAVPLYQQKFSDQQNILIHIRGKAATLAPGKGQSFNVGLIDPNAYDEVQDFQQADLDKWLTQTIEYYQGLYGELGLEDQEITHLLNRAIYQSFSSFGMNRRNEIVGSNWGSYPVTNRIWNKDMYYASLPFLLFDTELCQKTILWFTKYGIKFPGTKFPGGIQHSLSNSLSSVILAGLYYQYTEDLSFFEKHPEVLAKAQQIITDLLDHHKEDEPLLFHSTWISDAYALGKYHTGSNICFWRACQGLSLIYQGLNEEEQSDFYQELADRAKEEILQNMTIEGPSGKQFLEGVGDRKKSTYSVEHYQQPILEQGIIFLSDVIKEGQIQLLMHDGEESDTTLIPFYHFLNKTDSLYQHTMEFSASSANPTYGEEIRGIMWGQESGATFPGFITVLMGNFANKKKAEERIEELLQLADLDGSWWWWPYRLNPIHGQVVRDFGCGKCGWAAGMFVSLFITQYLGLQKMKGKIRIAPLEKVNFSWEKVSLGKTYFSVWCEDSKITVKNLSTEQQCFEFELNSQQASFTKGQVVQDEQQNYLRLRLAEGESFTIERSLL